MSIRSVLPGLTHFLRRGFCVRGLVAFFLLGSNAGWAQPDKLQDELSWDRNVRGLFQRYCIRCHGNDEPRGNVDLAQDENPNLILSHRRTWTTALEMLESEQMPPDDERQPNDVDRRVMIEFLQTTLASIDCEQVRDPGRPTLRRLNRSEYDNAIFDLTGLVLKLAENFPPDPTGYGFDNMGDALSLTPAQTEMFHDAARQVVAQLLNDKQQLNKVAQAIFNVAATAEPETEDFQPETQNSDDKDRGYAERVLTAFATQAFRQPVDAYYVRRLLRIFDQARRAGATLEQAIGHGLTAILISPRFLMRVELDRPNVNGPYRVSDYELATRLSFFLWSRPPDRELLELASQNQLHDPEVLRQETLRMLGDLKSRALVDNFFAQWLDLRSLETHLPDPEVFPEYDAELRNAIRHEAYLTLLEIVAEDRPVTWIIDSDHTYANARLAQHYGLPTVVGSNPVRVELPDRRRGGLIASAALLMLQSDPNRSNIPRRGNFIAGQLLGSSPPPPPPGVLPLDEANDGAVRSMRETFERHRSSPDCQACHKKIDPLGFSLENYDAIGRWRDTDAGISIDASADTSDGEHFVGIEGLKDHLLAQKDTVVHELSSRLMIYALGRGLQASDECVIESMCQVAKKADYRFSTLVLELVQSAPFTHRQNPEY